VLIVEDEVEIAKLIGLYVEKDGMTATLCETAELALAQSAKIDFDLVVLDLNLPGMDGFEFLRLLRKNSQVPVLILSSRKADEDMILGLGLGADDFVVKPFSPKVLVARVRAHIRRSSESQTGTRNIVRFGPFSFDKEGYALKREGARVQLSPKEFEVLDFLLAKPGTVFSAEAIYKAVWRSPYGDIATVAVHVQRLRKKIEANQLEPLYIRNIHGAGYYFDSDALAQ
jgi:two-component system response regulator RegX3